MTPFFASLILAICSAMTRGQEATLLFAGDAMMHQAQLDAARQRDGSYDFSDYFTAIAPQVREADYAVVNLETPLGGAPYSGYPCFCAPDSYADALADAGFDLFLTANNHMLDRRDSGLRRTVATLDAKGYQHIGTYRDAAQRDSLLPMVTDVNGFKVAFLNYTYGTNGISPTAGAAVDYIDRDLMRRDIASARQAGAELVCAAVHWGVEYQLLPHASQKSLAAFLMDEGVDMVIGGHPHVIQPLEMRRRDDGRNCLICYSLGNFISNMKTRDTRGGAMLEVKLARDSMGRAVVDDANYSLVFTVPPTAGKNFRLVRPDSCDAAAWRQHAKAFAAKAREIFTKHNVGVEEKE